jgi:hypothetical protein
VSEVTDETLRRLAEPFHPDDVSVKPQTVRKDGTAALPAFYITAREVMDRLDEVVGPANWQDQYSVLEGGGVLCRLSVRVGPEWVTKEDVGGPSEQPDPHDRLKAALSDALKRAAVKYGVGRYLYSLPPRWAAYDPQRKRFVETPRLPDWALPAALRAGAAAGRAADAPPAGVWQRVVAADAEWTRLGWIRAGELAAEVKALLRGDGSADLPDGTAAELAAGRAAEVEARVKELGRELKSQAEGR